MQSSYQMHLSPRCGAKTRATIACKSPAMANGRCRMHGGKSLGASIGNVRAMKHGHYSAEARAKRKELTELTRSIEELMKQMGDVE